MAEGVLFNIAEEIISKLGSSVWAEIQRWWGVKDELQELKTTVSTIKAVLLHAEEQFMESPQVKNWVGLLSDAMYDADDLLDEFSIHALHQQLMSGSRFSKEVRLFFSSSNQFAYGLKMAHQIKAMRDRLEKIKANKGFFLEERPAEATVSARLGRDQTHSSPPAVVIGRDHDKQAIIDLLLSSDSGDENVSIISIVGIGGLGKTTLAQLVYNDDKVQNHFELQMWACVSDDFDVQLIVQKILESATGKKPNVRGMDALKNLLHQKINGNKYLLVLDDVWNEDFNKWLRLKDLLAGGGRGSRIIITTRNKKVAEMVCSTYVHNLEGLLERESWSLFKQRAFKLGQVPSPSHEAAGKEILAKCKGVPLAINTTASLLFSKNSESEWLDFKNKELSKVKQHESDILPTLRLSYNHLPSNLKNCFAYCSLFPKGTSIKIGELIQLWIAEVYVASFDTEQSPEDVGVGYFMDLYQRSFFQEVEKDKQGNVRSCKMHDLMHDLASLVAGNKCVAVSSSGMASIKDKTPHVWFDSMGLHIQSLLKATKLRTLLRTSWKAKFTEEELHEIFCKLRCLRVLDLSVMGWKTLPSSIYKLKHLRHLDLSSNDRIKELPDSITQLYNLQALKLDGCFSLTQLPKHIKKLVSLKYLSNNYCNQLTHMPRGIGQLTQLEKLPTFVISKDDLASKHSSGVDELGGLNKLRDSLEIKYLRNVKNVSECKVANLKEKKQLQKLKLHFSDVNDDDCYDQTNENMVLEELRPHHNLKSFGLFGYRGARSPSWLPSITKLVSIELRYCNNIQRLPPFDNFSCLQRLEIQGFTKLKCMELSDGGFASFFPSLTEFGLRDCPNLEGFVRLSSSSKAELSCFPCLSDLHIIRCPNLRRMPLFPSLQKLTLVDEGIKSLEHILKTSVSQSTSSPSPFSALSQLKQLEIWNMNDFEAEELLQKLTCLEEFTFWDCPLKTLCSGDGKVLKAFVLLDLVSCEIWRIFQRGFNMLPICNV